MDWKQELDPVLKDYLNKLLEEVLKNPAYRKANDVKIAQLWVALAIIFRELNMLKSEIEEIKRKLNNKENKEKNILEIFKKY